VVTWCDTGCDDQNTGVPDRMAAHTCRRATVQPQQAATGAHYTVSDADGHVLGYIFIRPDANETYALEPLQATQNAAAESPAPPTGGCPLASS
jgi:hypothetical protein